MNKQYVLKTVIQKEVLEFPNISEVIEKELANGKKHIARQYFDNKGILSPDLTKYDGPTIYTERTQANNGDLIIRFYINLDEDNS